MKTPISTITAPFRLMKKLYIAEFFAVFIVVGLLAGYFSLNATSTERTRPLIFQGRLTDNSYVPVSDGSTIFLRFAFYDAASAGTCLWATGTDTATGSNNCTGGSGSARGISTTVTRGIFTASLGDTSVTNMPVLPLDFNPARIFIGVTACTAADSGCDSEMTPRVRVGAASYSYNADELDGRNSSQFLLANETLTLPAVTSGTATTTIMDFGAHTARPASELVDFDIDLARTVTFTTGAAITDQRALRIQSPTYAATAATQTLTNADTLAIVGAPTLGSNVAIGTSSALRIRTANVGASTASYGLYVDAMTGATTNYAAAFASGNVGIGDATPDYVLELNRSTGIANALSMSADDVTHGLTALHNGTFQQQLETGTFFQVGVLNGGGAGTGGALITGASDTDSTGLRLMGVIGAATPTDSTIALYLNGARSNGTTGRTTLADNDAVFAISNNDTPLLVMLGNGRIGIGSNGLNEFNPDTAIDIQSASSTADGVTIFNATGDSIIGFEVTDETRSYTLGLDNDDSDIFKISTTALGTNDFLRLDARTTTSGITAVALRGLAPTIASATGAEYTSLSVSPPTITLTGGTQVTSQMDSILFNSPLITDTTAVTVDDAALFTVDGAPTAGGSVTITDSYGLKIIGESVAGGGTVTRSYGLYVDAMSGATANYGAAFASGNVGILTATPNEALDVNGSIGVLRTGTAATTYTALATDYYIGMTSTAARTLNLPTAASITGRVYIIKDEGGNAGTNNITIDGSGAETIDGATTNVISANYGFRAIISDGTNWMIISRE